MYDQMDKNTVKAENQLKVGGHIVITNPNGKGKRVLFAGNSITLHGLRPEIGWNNVWGMAASSEDKDYVHILMKKVRETDEDAAFCVCQVAEWERSYKNDGDILSRYEAASEFGADIIVLRFIENCTKAEFDGEVFMKSLSELVKYLDKANKAKIIATTGFWKHPGDEYIIKFAKENNLPLINLGDLGEQDCMKAIGLFEHSGVANHPGDLGMQTIADRVYDVMKMYL